MRAPAGRHRCQATLGLKAWLRRRWLPAARLRADHASETGEERVKARKNRVGLGMFGPEFDQKAHVARIRPKLSNIGQMWPELGQLWPGFGLVEFRPKSVGVQPRLHYFGRSWLHFGWILAYLGQN